MPLPWTKPGPDPDAHRTPTLEYQDERGEWRASGPLPIEERSIMPPLEIKRVAMADHLAAVFGSEIDPDAQAAAQVPQLKKIAVALDQVANRTEHVAWTTGAIPDDISRTNEGDLEEAQRQSQILVKAASVGILMIGAMNQQLGTEAARMAPRPKPPEPRKAETPEPKREQTMDHTLPAKPTPPAAPKVAPADAPKPPAQGERATVPSPARGDAPPARGVGNPNVPTGPAGPVPPTVPKK